MGAVCLRFKGAPPLLRIWTWLCRNPGARLVFTKEEIELDARFLLGLPEDADRYVSRVLSETAFIEVIEEMEAWQAAGFPYEA